MKAKKMICTLVALVMTISLCACGGTGASGSNTSGKSLYEQGLGVISLMSEAASAEEYAGAYTGNPEILAIIQNVGAGDYTAPKAVYSLSVSDEVLLSMLGLENLNGISAELKENLLSRSFGSLIIQINGYAGVNNLAASSVLTLGKSFVSSSSMTWKKKLPDSTPEPIWTPSHSCVNWCRKPISTATLKTAPRFSTPQDLLLPCRRNMKLAAVSAWTYFSPLQQSFPFPPPRWGCGIRRDFIR